MTFGIAITLGTVVLAMVLFATEKVRVDLVGLLVLALMVGTGIVSPEEGVRGFSNPATVTVAAMFVLSAALIRTGGTDLVGGLFTRLIGTSPTLALVAMMVAVGVLSAFVNNTAAVAMFLPVVLGTARRAGIAPSKLLMPLSFASLFGGACTLVGTSTNILASEIARQQGAPPIRMFEMLPLGAVLLVAGILYMLFIGTRLIPDRRPAETLADTFHMAHYLTDLEVLAGCRSIGRTLAEAPLTAELDLDVLELVRADGDRFPLPSPDKVIQAGDRLRVRADVERIRSLQKQAGVALLGGGLETPTAGVVLLEAVVLPGSALEGRSLTEARFRNSYRATVLAVRHRGELVRDELRTVPLVAGDTLLLETRREEADRLRASEDLMLISETGGAGRAAVEPARLLLALGILVAVVALAAVGVLPIVATATVGAILVVATGCLSLDEAYEAIEWPVIFLLAGVLTLGVALESTGAAELLAGGLLAFLGPWGPVAVVSGLYLLTSLLTEAMSNNATVALLAPIALVTAEALGVDHRPLLMAVTFAASASFMTPVGYQTNTLIYGPGQYRFTDFLRVGTPLNLLFWLLATFLIPRIWPF